MIVSVVESVPPLPSETRTTTVYVPGASAVPVKEPALVNVTPGGSVPLTSAYVSGSFSTSLAESDCRGDPTGTVWLVLREAEVNRGGSFTGVTVIDTVAVSVPPLPSATV